jgi:hypothetical protein
MGREWGGGGQFKSNLGKDSTTQKEGFQESKGEISKGLRLDLILLICVYVS